METIPTTSRSLDRYYHINGDTFESNTRKYSAVIVNGQNSHMQKSTAQPAHHVVAVCAVAKDIIAKNETRNFTNLKK